MTFVSSSFIWVGMGILVAFALLLTYPLTTSFPVSHEIPQYLLDAQQTKYAFHESLLSGLKELSQTSWYPGTIAILVIADVLIPIEWPTLIIWLSVLMHLLIGIAIGVITYRISDKPSAALSIVLSATTFTIMRPILNGWMAQWWSLLFVAIVLERVWQKKYMHAAVCLLLTLLMHPLSFLILLLTAFLTFPSYLVQETNSKQKVLAIVIAVGFVIFATIWLSDKGYIFNSIHDSVPVYSLAHLLSSPMAVAVIAAPVGLLEIIKRYPLHPSRVFLLMYIFISIFLSFNHVWLNANFLEWRFEPYLLMSLALLGAIGITQIIQEVTIKKILQYILLGLVTITIVISSSYHMRNFFDAYKGNNELVLYTEEIDAIKWLKNLPTNTHILTTRHDLNYKWIPIITEYTWTGTKQHEVLYIQLTGHDKQLQKSIINEHQFTHLVVLKKRESELMTWLEPFNGFPTVFDNSAVLIKQLN